MRVLGEVSSQSTLANISNAIYDKINQFKEEITMEKISCRLFSSCFAEKNYYQYNLKSKAFIFFLNYKES